jgi:hypothetical protein
MTLHARWLLAGVLLASCGSEPTSNGALCAALAPPGDMQTAMLVGQPVEGAFVGAESANDFRLASVAQGGLVISVWGRLYSPAKTDHWWARFRLDADGEELGKVEWYVPACSGAWTDVTIPLKVYEEDTRGPCKMTAIVEAFDEEETMLLGSAAAEFNVNVLGPTE